jgi:hypothetical protein
MFGKQYPPDASIIFQYDVQDAGIEGAVNVTLKLTVSPGRVTGIAIRL